MIIRLGIRKMIENATAMAPAARRQKSRNAQKLISRLEGILEVLLLDVYSVEAGPRTDEAGGRWDRKDGKRTRTECYD